jgi:hopanoid biosynthesis associated RND transporter like protein HpnN
MLKKLIISTVKFCAVRPWPVIAIGVVLAALSASYVAARFEINTDISKLISNDLPWRQRELAFFKAFPSSETTIVAVIDGPTPELADYAAHKLTERLSQEKDVIKSVRQTSGGPFFRRNGLLFLSESELKEALGQLTKSRPLLEPLAADPSLRGIMASITLTLKGVQGRRLTLDSLAPQFNAFSTAIENSINDRPAWFSWREALSGQPSTRRETRQFIEIEPILDYNSLTPGQDATNAIRKTASDLGLPQDGVTVRLTGSVPIADEEFGTLKEGAGLNTALTILSVLVILWLALHSARIIFAVFVALFIGLAMTAALGLAMVGALNPISVAFFVLFVGIGVDFGLQFSVGYRAERFERNELAQALVATADHTGGRLVLAALATACGFLAFTPTAYKGLSELGLIAGVGMLIAFLTSITVLPALLRLLNPPAEAHPLGYSFLAPVDRFLERHRMGVLVGTLCVVMAGLPLLHWLRFDFNPMNLRNPNVESVATYLDLKKDPETAGRTIEVLTPSVADADALATKLGALPEVARAMTLGSFVPEGQDKKIVLISQAAADLNETLNPKNEKVLPAPTDQEIVSSLEGTSNFLSVVAKRSPGTKGVQAAERLSNALSELAKANTEARARAADALVSPLKMTLDDIRLGLNPEKITLDSLPPDLVAGWKAHDGEVRVSVSPKGDSEDNAVLRHFVEAVTAVAPNATGEAIGIQKAGDTIVNAFIQAAIWALVSIAILLWITLKRASDVALTLFPLLLACVVTLELCVILDMPLNFANIIALPLLLGVGVAFKIYYIMAWREGRSGLLASPLTRAVFFSGMTTAVAFGSLWLSNHPGTSSMGKLLALSLVSTMAAAVLFQPLLMGPPREVEKPVEEEGKGEAGSPAYLPTPEHTA